MSSETQHDIQIYVSDVHGEYEQLKHVFANARTFIESKTGTACNVEQLPIHFLGDIYDRGPSPDAVMDDFLTCPNLDIQWGNHDIVWMGASLGSRACLANVVRICARYGNLSILEDTYGIDLTSLRNFANTVYAKDPCVAFGLKGTQGLNEEQIAETERIQKAMAFIQFKVEAQTIAENPSFGLEDRNLLHHINASEGTIEIEGATYELTDTVFPTIDFDDPYTLTTEEASIIDQLEHAFTTCEKLQAHMRLFLDRGSLYKIVGNNLLFHACVPLNPDGSLKEVALFGKKLKGKALFDAVDAYVRAAYTATDESAKKQGLDMLWYLWLGSGSPLFAKSKMATFELYLCSDKDIRKEEKNSFYKLLEDKRAIAGIFEDFGMNFGESRIICGHTPIKVKDGEDPIKCAGHIAIIDGGMSRAYQKTTGIAGISIVQIDGESWLLEHKPCAAAQKAEEGECANTGSSECDCAADSASVEAPTVFHLNFNNEN